MTTTMPPGMLAWGQFWTPMDAVEKLTPETKYLCHACQVYGIGSRCWNCGDLEFLQLGVVPKVALYRCLLVGELLAGEGPEPLAGYGRTVAEEAELAQMYC